MRTTAAQATQIAERSLTMYAHGEKWGTVLRTYEGPGGWYAAAQRMTNPGESGTPLYVFGKDAEGNGEEIMLEGTAKYSPATANSEAYLRAAGIK